MQGGRWRANDPGWRGVVADTDGTVPPAPGFRRVRVPRLELLWDRSVPGARVSVGMPRVPVGSGKSRQMRVPRSEERVSELRLAVPSLRGCTGSELIPVLNLGIVSWAGALRLRFLFFVFLLPQGAFRRSESFLQRQQLAGRAGGRDRTAKFGVCWYSA